MAMQSKKTVMPQFIANARSAEALRKQIAAGPIEAAKQASFRASVDVFTLLSALPEAFVLSQKREYERLQRQGQDNDPRLQRLKASIETANALAETAKLGQSRVERIVTAFADDKPRVHGFVSGEKQQAMPNLGVRLQLRGDGKEEVLSGKTDSDGYFSIALGQDSPRYSAGDKNIASLSDRMTEALSRIHARSTTESSDTRKPDATTGRQLLAQLEIYDVSGALLHRDPDPLALDGGSVYREYALIESVLPRKDDLDAVKTRDAAATPVEKPKGGKPSGQSKGKK